MTVPSRLHALQFKNRSDAGKKLAGKLSGFIKKNSIVVGLPRGGVELAFEIAKMYKLPFTVLMVRKMGAPFNTELGIGAIAENNVLIYNKKLIDELAISKETLRFLKQSEKKELLRRKHVYRNNKHLTGLTNASVILVDDGAATGYTAVAAVRSVKKKIPQSIIFATPVSSSQSKALIEKESISVVSFIVDGDLKSIGGYYQSFPQLSDDQVKHILETPM